MANFEHEDDSRHVNMAGESPAVSAPVPPPALPSVPDKPVAVVTCSIPSFAAASELLSAPYSCLVMNTHRRHIALPPMYIKKKKTGIQEELETELLKFSQRLNSVPLAYDNVRIVGQQGDIYDDSGYIHMDIEATFILFQPKKGQKLLGTVNKLGLSHVGCLVHGCFNASIPKPNLVTMETWRDFGPRIGAELEFEVMALDADVAGVLLIRGRLSKTRVQEMLAQGESTDTSVPVDQTDAEDTTLTPEPSQESPEETPQKKKKKKKKKDQVKEEEIEEEISLPPVQPDRSPTLEPNGTTDQTDGGEAAEKKKKKKKKKKEKHVKEEEEEIEISHTEVHGSDSSGYQSDKPSKKRKHEMSNDPTSDFSEEPEPPKSKKKRKKDIEQFA